MKRSILLLFCLVSGFFAKAQVTEHRNAMVLRVDSAIIVTDDKLVQIRDRQLQAGKTATAELIQNIEKQVADALVAAAGASRRFDITDIATAKKMEAELRSELAMEMSDVERRQLLKNNADKAFVSDWILQANITHCQFTRKGNYGWTCILHVTPIVRDRRDPALRIIDSRPFVSDIKDIAIKTSREDAIATALETMKEDLIDYFTNNFPVYAKIVRLTENNDAEINCGVQNNVKEGDEFQVEHICITKDDDGKRNMTTKLIGTIKVKDIRSQSAICKLTSGDDRIMDVNAQGGYLRCRMIMK